MTPFDSFAYFALLLYVVVPTLLLGLTGRLPRWWVLGCTLVVLAVQFGCVPAAGPRHPLWHVLRFVIWQVAVAQGFLWVRRRVSSTLPAWLAVLLALLPLLRVRILTVSGGLEHIEFIGLAYVTLRCVDVIIVIQDRLISSLRLSTYLAYTLFFPTISAGPLDRYLRFEADLARQRGRPEFLADVDEAVGYFVNGLFYKFVVAVLIERHWLGGGALGNGSFMYAYTLFLFFDFAGYSSLAIAYSLLLGIHTPRNFHLPFAATNIREFWNRWHISLSWWLRDHVYMRFQMAAMRRGWFHSRGQAAVCGYLVAFGLMGVWHGLWPRYLLYGLYHALLMIGFDMVSHSKRLRRCWGQGPLWRLAGAVLTFHAVCFGLLIMTGRLWSTPAAAANLGGEVERWDCTGISGWVRSADVGATPPKVVLYRITDASNMDNPNPGASVEVVGEVAAGAASADGRCPFSLVIPSRFKDGDHHTFSVRARVAGAEVNLQNSPHVMVCGTATLSGWAGEVEVGECGRLSGYAIDRTHPTAVVSVDIFCDGRPLATVEANLPRAGDVHGFRYEVPASLRDGQQHRIQLLVKGGDLELAGSPLQMKCP